MLGMQASTSANPVSQSETASLLDTYDAHKASRSEFVSSLMSTMRFASIVLLGYWGLIFIGTHLPSAKMPHLHASDKFYHFVAFAGLAFLLCWAIPSSRVSWLKILGLAALIAISYAVVDELTQQFIPGRTCDIWDVCADAVGVVLGLIAYSVARLLVSRMKWVQRILAPNS